MIYVGNRSTVVEGSDPILDTNDYDVAAEIVAANARRGAEAVDQERADNLRYFACCVPPANYVPDAGNEVAAFVPPTWAQLERHRATFAPKGTVDRKSHAVCVDEIARLYGLGPEELSDEDRCARAVELRSEGLSIPEIVTRLGMTQVQVRRALKNNGKVA